MIIGKIIIIVSSHSLNLNVIIFHQYFFLWTDNSPITKLSRRGKTPFCPLIYIYFFFEQNMQGDLNQSVNMFEQLILTYCIKKFCSVDMK